MRDVRVERRAGGVARKLGVVVIAGLALSALAGCGGSGAEKGSENGAENGAENGTSAESTPIECTGVRLSIEGSAVLRPGVEPFPAYTVSAVGEDDDGVYADLRGVDDGDGGFGAVVLHRGEAVEDPAAGVFTLLDAEPSGEDATEHSVSLCLDPHPDFELAEGL